MNDQHEKLIKINMEAEIEYYKDLFDCKLQEQKNMGFFERVGKKADHVIDRWKRGKKRRIAINYNGLNKDEPRDNLVIVSLTSYPGRINCVCETIKTLLNQTYKPDKIILWLGEEKFPYQKLPQIYDELRKAGVDILFRPDLKSHTKYFYAVQEYPEDIIITVDDDVYYEETLVEQLVASYRKCPRNVSAMRAHKIRFDDQCGMLDYDKWIYEYDGAIGSSSHTYMATGVGGVLYPPHTLHPEVTNLDVIKAYCHNHDDFWLKIMEVMNGTKVVLASSGKHRTFQGIRGSQNSAQWKENVIEGGNNRQAEATLNYYNFWHNSELGLAEIIAYDLDVETRK